MFRANLNVNAVSTRNPITVSGSASSTDYSATYNHEKAFDNNTTGTYWRSSEDTVQRLGEQWIGFHFGDAPRKIQYMEVVPYTNASYAVNRYLVQASNDENSDWSEKEWVLLLDNQDPSETTREAVEFENNNYYKFYRLYIEDTDTWLLNPSYSWILYEVMPFDNLEDYSGSLSNEWNPNDANAAFTFSNNNRTVSKTSGGSSWVSFVAKYGFRRGKWYWEYEIDTNSASNNDMVGVVGMEHSLSNYPGQSVYGTGYYGNNGRNYFAGTGTVYGNSFTAGDVVGVALDVDNRKLWFSKNGVWQNSGDPANGLNPIPNNSQLSNTTRFTLFFPCISHYGQGAQSTSNFKVGHLQYTPPAGFNIYPSFYSIVPSHNGKVYGQSEQLGFYTSISGADYFDTDFYVYTTWSGYGLFSTTSGILSPGVSNYTLTTNSGIAYNWFAKVTTSGQEFYTPTYTFDNRYLFSGYTALNGTLTSGIKVRLYRRSTGELVGEQLSTASGTFTIESTFNEYHNVMVMTQSDTTTNAEAYDWLDPRGV